MPNPFDLLENIKSQARKTSAEKLYNKDQVTRLYKDSQNKGVLEAMPETDFCKITKVRDCKLNKQQKICSCTIEMLFGQTNMSCSEVKAKPKKNSCNFDSSDFKCQNKNPTLCDKDLHQQVCIDIKIYKSLLLELSFLRTKVSNIENILEGRPTNPYENLSGEIFEDSPD